MDAKRLFDAVRMVKGAPLTQADVDLINRVLMAEVARSVVTGRKVSPAGIAIIEEFEGFRSKAYPDPGSKNGKPVTCGFGSTRHLDGRPIQLGEAWTREYALQVRARDLLAFEAGVNQLVGAAPTTQPQFDALVSLAYNIGLDIDDDAYAEGLGDSTLLKKHIAGDYAGAQAAFASWRFNDGKELAGLVRRRAAEAALYGQ